jgi:hypothetical protein
VRFVEVEASDIDSGPLLLAFSGEGEASGISTESFCGDSDVISGSPGEVDELGSVLPASGEVVEGSGTRGEDFCGIPQLDVSGPGGRGTDVETGETGSFSSQLAGKNSVSWLELAVLVEHVSEVSQSVELLDPLDGAFFVGEGEG